MDSLAIYVAEQSPAFAPVVALVAVDGFSAEYIILQIVPSRGLTRCVSHRRYRLEPEEADERLAVEPQFIEDMLVNLFEFRDRWVRYNCAFGVRFVRTASPPHHLDDAIRNARSDDARAALFAIFQHVRTHARTLQIKRMFDDFLRRLETQQWDLAPCPLLGTSQPSRVGESPVG